MKKILLVEDDDNILMALTVRLRAAGYDVSVAQDGFSGVQQACRIKPDLIISDISMPAGDGFSVAERVNTAVSTVGTPIIFLTAMKDPDLYERAIQVGAVGFFEKPLDSARLLLAVREALGESA
ncbi:MAG TPA: response regulator [Planctomycetota bacterium]